MIKKLQDYFCGIKMKSVKLFPESDESHCWAFAQSCGVIIQNRYTSRQHARFRIRRW